jgi:hypothetical protein
MAVDFNGIADGAQRRDYSNNIVGVSGNIISFSFWIWADDPATWDNVFSLNQVIGSGGGARDANVYPPGDTGTLSFSYGGTSGARWQEYDFDLNGVYQDQWVHCVASGFDHTDPTTPPTVYRNGSTVSVGSSGGTHGGARNSGIDSLRIGNYDVDATPDDPYNGYLCELAFWNAALTAKEVYMLAMGLWSPVQVQPGALFFYDQMLKHDSGRDLIGGATTSITTGGSSTVPHPPIVSGFPIMQPPQTFPDDKIFALGYPATDTPGMFRASFRDPRQGMVEVDSGNRPGAHAGGAVASCIGGPNGRQIGVISIGSSDGDDPTFDLFDMDTQEWIEKNDVIAAETNSSAAVGIVWRPIAQEFVVAWVGDTVGGNRDTWFSRRTAPSTWSTPAPIDPPSPPSAIRLQTLLLGDDDLVHFVLRTNFDQDLYLTTLKADNTLTPWPSAPFFTAGGSDALAGVGAATRWDENA